MMAKNTKEQLIEAGIKVFSTNIGAPMSKVAEEAGVGRATLYRYFPAREDLIRHILVTSYEESITALNQVKELEMGSDEVTGEKMLMMVLEKIIPQGDRYNFLLMENRYPDDEELQALALQDEESWYSLILTMKSKGLFAQDVPTAWVISALEGLIYAAWSSVEGGYIARRDASKLVFRTLTAGLCLKTD